MTDYSIFPYTPDHFPLMKDLFKAAFGMRIKEDAFRRKYDTVELGHAVIGFLAVHLLTQTPAAFYGVFPVKILWDEREILAAQSGDTMTHPAHQRKGLFTHLANLTYAVCRQKNIGLIFGQPNKNSYQGLVNRLHFLHLDEVMRYDLKRGLKTIPLAKLAQKAGCFHLFLSYAKKILAGVTIAPLHSFCNPLPVGYAKVLRNRDYLRYKNESDKFFIRLRGATFWLKLTDVLWIGEVDNYAAVDARVLRQLKQLAFRLGYNTLSFHLNKSIAPPAFLQSFNGQIAEASCFLYLNKELEGTNLVLTGADFDTW